MEVTGERVRVDRYTLDRYGDRVPGETFYVERAAFAARSLVQASTAEETDRSQQVRSQAELYTPPGSGITAGDVVTLGDGSRWEVEGSPETWWSPFTAWQPGDVALLHRTQG